MATVTIRNLDDSTIATLKAIAAEHGRSMEAEVRDILKSAAEGETTRPSRRRLGDEIHAMFAGLDASDLTFERDKELPRAVIFDE
jgi:plasmid stability protein